MDLVRQEREDPPRKRGQKVWLDVRERGRKGHDTKIAVLKGRGRRKSMVERKGRERSRHERIRESAAQWGKWKEKIGLENLGLYVLYF